MILIQFAIRHLLHYWRFNLVFLLTLFLGIASLASIPVYQQIISDRDIQQVMLRYSYPGARNLLVQAEEGSRLDGKSYDLIKGKLDDFILDRIEVGEAIIPSQSSSSLSDGSKGTQKFHFYHLWSFPNPERWFRLVEGRFPRYQDACQHTDIQNPAILEVAVGSDAARKKEVQVGDLYSADGAQGSLLLAVVGILEPIDPQHDIWWEDRSTFSYQLKLIGRSIELVTLSMHVSRNTLEDCFPDSTFTWRILLDGERIAPQNAEWLQETLNNLQSQLSKDHAELQSGLPSILRDFQARLDTASVVALLIAGQTFIFTGIAIWMLVSLQMELYWRELSRLNDRGISNRKIFIIFAFQDLLLALLAAFLAWLVLSFGGNELVSVISGSKLTEGISPREILAQNPILVFLPAGLFWVLIIVQSFWSSIRINSRKQTRGTYRFGCRLSEHPIWQRLYLDVALLLLSGILYWQLIQSGSPIVRRFESAHLVDPFLLLSSTMLVFSAILVILRFFPYLFRALSWFTKGGLGSQVFLAVSRLSNDLLKPGQIIILVSLAISFTFLANAFQSSLVKSQEETAYRIAGADLRLSSSVGTPEATLDSVSGIQGIIASSPIFRSDYPRLDFQSVELIAIDPKSFSKVNRTLQNSQLNRLHWEISGNYIPAIFSNSLVSSIEAIGTQRELLVFDQELQVKIVGIAPFFPTADKKFILMDITQLAKHLNLDSALFSSEVWLTVDDRYADQLIRENRLQDRILSSARSEMQILQADAISQGIIGAFRLNALALNLLSLIAFLVLHLFSIGKQSYETKFLLAMDFEPVQLSRISMIQGLLVLVLGLLEGIGIGYSMTRLLLPYLWMILAHSPGEVEVHSITIEWIDIIRYFAILSGAYISCLLFIFLTAKRKETYDYQVEEEE